MKGKIAIIGDADSILAFKAGGVEVFEANDSVAASDTLKSIAEDYSIIFLPDVLARDMGEVISRYKSRAYPIILPIPSKDGNTGYGMQSLKKTMEQALGVDILFGDDKN